MTESKSRLFIAVSLLGLGWTSLCLFRLQWASTEEIFWTTLLFGLCCLPTILFIAGPKSKIPLMPMWGLGYFLMFGMPMLSREIQGELDFIIEGSVVKALQLTVFGAVACVLAFYTLLGRWIETVVPRLKAPWNSRRAPWLGVSLALFGVIPHYYQLISAPSFVWGQLFFIGSQLSIVGMLTLFLLQLRKQLSKPLTVFLWGIMVPLEFLLRLGTGALWTVFQAMAPFLFCYAVERGKIPWKALAIVTLCLIPFLGFKHEYRSYAWYAEGDASLLNAPPIQRSVAFIQLVGKRLREGGAEAYTFAAETAQKRISHLSVLINVMEMTPAQIPFWNGETYRSFPWLFLPRALFPEKPEKTLGQEFGHRYGFIDPSNFDTSFNLPHQVIEMFINFGTVGVLIGMSIMGFIYRAIAILLSHPNAGERSLIIGCALLANLLSLDSDFSLVFGGVVYYVLVMYVIVRFLGEPAKVA